MPDGHDELFEPLPAFQDSASSSTEALLTIVAKKPLTRGPAFLAPAKKGFCGLVHLAWKPAQEDVVFVPLRRLSY